MSGASVYIAVLRCVRNSLTIRMCCAVYVCFLCLRRQDVSDGESELAVAGACDGELLLRLTKPDAIGSDDKPGNIADGDEKAESFAGLSSEEEVHAAAITAASEGVAGEAEHEKVVTYSNSRIVATDEVCN